MRAVVWTQTYLRIYQALQRITLPVFGMAQPSCIRHPSQFGTFAHFHDFRVNLANLIVVYAFLIVVAVLVRGGEPVRAKSACHNTPHRQ